MNASVKLSKKYLRDTLNQSVNVQNISRQNAQQDDGDSDDDIVKISYKIILD